MGEINASSQHQHSVPDLDLHTKASPGQEDHRMILTATSTKQHQFKPADPDKPSQPIFAKSHFLFAVNNLTNEHSTYTRIN
jgi:hypothetical protein